MNILKHLANYIKHPVYRSVGLLFSINSILFGTWVTRIPDVKERLDLNDAELGTALLGFPIGSISGMLITGWLISKFGAGKVTFIATILYCVFFVIPLTAPTYLFLFVSLIISGVMMSMMDIAMNDCASVVEKKEDVNIMSTCHGFWSIGGMAGAALGSYIVGLQVQPHHHMMLMAGLMIALVFLIRRHVIDIDDRESAEAVFAIPSKSLLILSLVAFCIMLNEGAIADWSAIYFKETLSSGAYITGFGYAAFSFAMAIGRFLGDTATPIYGEKRILIVGSLLSAISMAISLIMHDPIIAIIGFCFTGLGFSCTVPIVFSKAAKTPGMASGSSIAAVATFGYTGFLIGPPFIGFVAHHADMTMALSLVVALSLLASLFSSFVK